MNVMSVKRKFTIDEVINLTENCYYVTVDDVRDLCVLREIGFKNVRWTGGCWIAEKDENDVNGDKHGGMLVCLSVRVGIMLDEYSKKEKWKPMHLGRFGRSNEDWKGKDNMVTLSFKELLSFCLNNDKVDAKDYTLLCEAQKELGVDEVYCDWNFVWGRKKDKYERWEILVKLNSGLTVEGKDEILSWWKKKMEDNYKRGKIND